MVDPDRHRHLFDLVGEDPDVEFTVDLAAQVIHLPGDEDLEFDIDPFVKLMILAGTDELGYLLSKLPAIDRWETAHPARVDTLLGPTDEETAVA